MDAKDYFKVLEKSVYRFQFYFTNIFKEITTDVVARIILTYFLTNRAEYKKSAASH